jgi:hypothetical protein
MSDALAANTFQGSIAIGARNGLIAVLSPALSLNAPPGAPASESVNVSIGTSLATASFRRGATQASTGAGHVWAADLFTAHPAGQRLLPPPAQSEGRPGERYRAALAALARNAGHAPLRPDASRSVRALAASVGSKAAFWVSTSAIGQGGGAYASVPATLRGTSAHGIVWVDDTLSFDAASVAHIGSDFETAYDSDTRHFGTAEYTVAAPGASLTAQACDASGNPIGGAQAPMLIAPPGGRHVVLIVNQNTLGAGMGGYFSAVNDLPQAVANCFDGHPPSNEASMIVLGYAPGADLNYVLKEDFVRGTAHEFQHAINFVQHFVLAQNARQEEGWIDEGLSMLAQDFAVSQTFNGTPSLDVDDALARAQQYMSQPEAFSLTAFSGMTDAAAFANNCSGCYGDSYLFERYLYDRFGGDAFAHAMESAGLVGNANLQAATGQTPQALIADYGVALAVSGLNLTTNPRFSFTAFDPYGAYRDQFGNAYTFKGPAVTLLAPGSTLTYTSFVGTFRYFATQPNIAQGAGVTVTDAGGGLALTPALIQH